MTLFEMIEAFLINVCKSFSSTQSSFAKHIPALLRPYVALLLMFLTSFFLTLSNVLIKKLHSVDPYSINAICNIVMAAMALPILIAKRQSPFPEGSRLVLLLRGFVGAFCYLLLMYALKHMPIGDANAIAASTPSIVVIMAWLLLKEPVVLNDIINVVMVTMAVLFIAQPSVLFASDMISSGYQRDPNYDFSAFLMLVFCFSLALGFTSLRVLKDIPAVTVLFVMGVEAFVFSLASGLVLQDEFQLPEDSISWFWAIAIGVLLFTLEITMTLACQIETAGLVSIVQQTFTVLLTICLQLLLYQEYPNPLGYLGFLITVIVSMNLTCRKLVESLGPESSIHKLYDNLCCITWPECAGHGGKDPSQ